MALYQKCAHLGCRVPFCEQSQWFECPCHGSKYNYAGEWQLGPAPNGLQRFTVTVDGSTVRWTRRRSSGPARGTNTDPPAARGPVLRMSRRGGAHAVMLAIATWQTILIVVAALLTVALIVFTVLVGLPGSIGAAAGRTSRPA
jgi:hypothetical protein